MRLPPLPRLALVLLLALAPGAARAETALETAVKATFVTKFAGFVDWPQGGAGRLTLCVMGDAPVVTAVQRALGGGETFRPLVVQPLAGPPSASACDILYADGPTGQSVAQALEAVKGRPVLTITDAAHSSTRGMIHFVVVDDRVRFHIDAGAASRAGIGISSKLLALALSVKR